ncbi:hypothetical protein XA68_12174 [Ophiocordyceps unilateralis]|uniref:Uncharacterized protein n=1 Tax=Ophiocordyceps unilateralis TaxID=268505 RepID=A0A2A9PPK5_OPHUN|nr:hypothetical protein XA68_12174 [Ophiocordyceps unilateralis]
MGVAIPPSWRFDMDSAQIHRPLTSFPQYRIVHHDVRPEYAHGVEAEWTGFSAPTLGLTSRCLQGSPSGPKFGALMCERKGSRHDTLPPRRHGLLDGFRLLFYRLLSGAWLNVAAAGVTRCATGFRPPQHPFPAALLDALVSYLALLYPPPPDAFHEPVSPGPHRLFGRQLRRQLVCVALVQAIIELRRLGWRPVPVARRARPPAAPIRAGVTCISPFLDPHLSKAPSKACCAGEELLAHDNSLLCPPPPHASPTSTSTSSFEPYQAMTPYLFPAILPSVPSSHRCLDVLGHLCLTTSVHRPATVELSATLIRA